MQEMVNAYCVTDSGIINYAINYEIATLSKEVNA